MFFCERYTWNKCWFIEDHWGGPLCVLRNHVFKPVFTQIWTSEGWLDCILSAGNLTNFSILVRSTHRRKTHSLPSPYAFNFLHLSSHVAHLVSRLWDKGWTKTGMPTAAWSEKKNSDAMLNLLWFQSSYQFRKHIMIHVYLICKKSWILLDKNKILSSQGKLLKNHWKWHQKSCWPLRR